MPTPPTYDVYNLYLSYVYVVLLFAIAQQLNVVRNILNVSDLTPVPAIYILLYKPPVMLKDVHITNVSGRWYSSAVINTSLCTIHNHHYIIEVLPHKKVRNTYPETQPHTTCNLLRGVFTSNPYMLGHYKGKTYDRVHNV